MVELASKEITDVKSLAVSYFPDIIFTDEASLETKDKGEIFSTADQVLPYLQTIFFEEHMVEIQINETTRIFFAHITDELPDLIEEEDDDGELVIVEPEYEAASYLKRKDSFLLTPLTPGIGNAQIRTSKRLIVRFFTGTIAIELGCSFREQTSIRDIPVLRVNFPVIGRVNRQFRSFRIKALPSINAKVRIERRGDSSISEILYPIIDVSAEGLAFQMPSDHPPFQTGQDLRVTVSVEGIKGLEVSGNVRHVTKARDNSGLKVSVGMQFDLETRALAADLEKLAATIQRLHLRQVSENTADLEGVSLIR